MAKPEAAACAAIPRPFPTPAALAAARAVDAVDDIECRLLALEAVEQLVMPQKLGTTEDLSHVDRAGFGWLLTIINVDLRQTVITAREAAEAVHGITKGGQA